MQNIKPFSLRNISTYRTELYGLSILWIMLFHSYAVYPPWLNWFLSYGNMGVEIFLFASGVSLYYAMQKKPTISRYFQRRLVRILIPLWVISIWEWLYLLFAGKIRFLQLVARMTLTNFWLTGNQQAWFLSLLLVAYVIFPYVYSFLFEGRGRLRWRTAFVLFVVVGFILMIYFLVPDFYEQVEIALPRLPVFILGCAFGRAVYEDWTIERHTPLLLAVLLLLAAIGFVVLNLQILSGIAKRLFYVIPGTALTLLLSRLFARTSGSVFNRFCRFFGNMSVELYLIHLLGRRLLPATGFYDPDSHLHYLLMLCASVALGCLASRIDKFLAARISRHIS